MNFDKNKPASLSAKQAIGILLLIFGGFWLIGLGFTIPIFIIRCLTGSEKYLGWITMVALIITIDLIYGFVSILAVFGVKSLQDKNGMVWPTFKM